MCLIIICHKCGRKQRFTGKKSQISRNDIRCVNCKEKINFFKKGNGKFAKI